jgi:NAD+ synthase (glutamine-hydrolysing)
VLGAISASEYKRRQAPLALKVTRKAFGVGRRFPIGPRFREGLT